MKVIDENEDLYLRMQKTPILYKDSILPTMIGEAYLMDFLTHIFNQGPQAALRRTNYMDGWGAYYERDMRRWYELDQSKLVRVAYKLSRML